MYCSIKTFSIRQMIVIVGVNLYKTWDISCVLIVVFVGFITQSITGCITELHKNHTSTYFQHEQIQNRVDK